MFTKKEVLLPGINIYKNAIKEEWDLVNRFENILSKEEYSWNTAKVGKAETSFQFRKCQDFKFREDGIKSSSDESIDLLKINNLVYSSLKECLEDYKKDYGVEVNYYEAVNLVKYGEGEFFKAHSDDDSPYRCTVSAVGYINDDYDGGELWYKFFNLSYTPCAGDFVIFPSTYIYAHEAKPVFNGIKYSMVIMTDRSDFAHKKDSPIYHTMES